MPFWYDTRILGTNLIPNTIPNSHHDGTESESVMGVLWNFVLTSLLLTNAVCILHEKRFLKPCAYARLRLLRRVGVSGARGASTTSFVVQVLLCRKGLMICAWIAPVAACTRLSDGWHQVDASQGMTIKNQMVGFLVAVQYLRGASASASLACLRAWDDKMFVRRIANVCASLTSLCVAATALSVPLIVVNALMIVLELIMG